MDTNKYKKYLKLFLNFFLFQKINTFKYSCKPYALPHKKTSIFVIFLLWQAELKHIKILTT